MKGNMKDVQQQQEEMLDDQEEDMKVHLKRALRIEVYHRTSSLIKIGGTRLGRQFAVQFACMCCMPNKKLMNNIT